MQLVSVNELADQKIFSVDLYNEDGEKLFSAGEIITPGKLMQLRSLDAVYSKVDGEEEKKTLKSAGENTDDLSIQEKENKPSDTLKTGTKKQESLPEAEEEDETFSKDEFSTEEDDDDDVSDNVLEIEIDEQLFNKQINLYSIITPENQIKMKKSFKRAMNDFKRKTSVKKVDLFLKTRDLILETLIPVLDTMIYKSQLKIIGEYDDIHGLNVAIMAAALTIKMKMTESEVNDIVLAALLHDIGKTRIDESILKKTNLSTQDVNLLNLHTQIGYKILHKDFHLSEPICKVALEHHENNDGSGYPYGISGDLIGLPSQIVNICNFYDNLTSERLNYPVKNTKDALKIILEIGYKNFLSGILYTFINMTNYNDSRPFKSFTEE